MTDKVFNIIIDIVLIAYFAITLYLMYLAL